MHITDHLQPACIALRRPVASLPEAVRLMAGLLAQSGDVTDADAFAADVQKREALGATRIGGGLAIPHAKSKAVREVALAALTLDPPLGCTTPDGEPVRMMFLIAAPDGANDLHVQVLAELAKLLMDKALCAKLMQAQTPQAFYDLIAAQERRAPEPQPPKPHAAGGRLLAVTACPSGLAHTYLAAEALQKAARSRGLDLKVETNGAMGVEHPLTSEEIANADCILVAADRSVPMARFVGKRVLTVTTREAIRDAQGVLDRAAAGRTPVYRGGNALRTNDWRELGREAYRHLMAGISHMLPFVVAGGVMIAVALLLDQLGAPPVAGDTLNTLGRTAFVLVYPVLAAFIAHSIGDTPAFMPGLMGGYLAQLGVTAAPEAGWVSSGFWGALVAGFAAGMLVRLLQWLCDCFLPPTLEHIRAGLLLPAFGLLGVGLLMVLIVNPPLGDFNTWLCTLLSAMNGGSRLALGAVLGLLMATDYGGPINKAAYVTGTVALVSEQYDIMASVMVGGMVPPIGVALACLLFENRFTAEERRTVPQNLLMGASFVTEGALPFALRDPLRVGPACMLGSGLAGFLTVFLRCGCPAPHGGLFLIAVIQNPLGFLLALLAGSLLTAALLGILKKPLQTS